MPNVTQLYRDSIQPSPPDSAAVETEKLKAEQSNIIKWEEWRANPTTKEFLKILEDARNKLLVGKVEGKEMFIGWPDAILNNPQIPDAILRVKLAEIGTLQKVLRTSLDGIYEK